MNNKELIRVFNNLGFKIEKDDIFDEAIIMNPEDAYLFSATTGSKYMFYKNGVTMKGRAEIFIHRSIFSNLHLIYSPGLFSRNINGSITEGNSSNNLLKKYPCVFSGNKRIVIIDIKEDVVSNIESHLFNSILEKGKNPDDYVIYKNFLSNDIGESLLEYFASIIFIRKGYLVENQTPWFQQNYQFEGKILQGGIPDFSAFHSNISKQLYEYNFISENKGVSLLLLPVIKLFRSNLFMTKKSKEFKHELIIGEAKTSSSSLPQAKKQLDKYNAVKIADEFFTIISNSKENDKYGSMYIENDNIIFKSKNRCVINNQRTTEDSKWIDTYVKMLLLGNLSFEKIIEIIDNFRKYNNLGNIENYESTHLLDAIQNIDNNYYFEIIKENF